MVLAARLLPFLRLLFVAALAALAVAQKERTEIRYVVPEKLERATKTDASNMIQWDEHKPPQCATCSGSGKTKCTTCDRFGDDAPNCPECKRTKDRLVPCRSCAGTGAWPDPLEKVHCPGCMAAGFLVCTICMGGGRLKIDKAKQWSDCPGCRGEGGWKCGVCSGNRLVETAALKPSLKDAGSAALAKAITVADQTLQAMTAFTPTGGVNARKEVKALIKAFETGQAVFPPLKRTPKVLDDFMGKIYGGSQFQGHETHQANAMNLVKTSAEYYVKHQKRMMELAQKRAEANEKLAAENKGK